jgi:hypothetical protein
MPSPLPGMDPYLESPVIWPAFQHALCVSLYQLIQPGIADRYRVKVVTRKYTTEIVLFTSIAREPQSESYVEIRGRNDDKLVTVINPLSPTNKTTPTGKAAYLATRDAAIAAKAGTVEIDLLTQGVPPLDFDRTGLPPCQYTVTVTRPLTPERFEVYAATLRVRLPKFKMPLATDDRETVVDLQAAISRAYDASGAANHITYGQLPASVSLGDDDRTWVQQTAPSG